MNLLKIISYLWPLVREVLFNHDQERMRPLGLLATILTIALVSGYLGWTEHGQAVRETFFPSEEDDSAHYQQLMEDRISELLGEKQSLENDYQELQREMEQRTWMHDPQLLESLRGHIAELQAENERLQSVIEDKNQQIERLQRQPDRKIEEDEDEKNDVVDRIRELY